MVNYPATISTFIPAQARPVGVSPVSVTTAQVLDASVESTRYSTVYADRYKVQIGDVVGTLDDPAWEQLPDGSYHRIGPSASGLTITARAGALSTVMTAPADAVSCVDNVYTPDAFDASKHLLILYADGNADSAALAAYLRDHRPGFSGANLLGLPIDAALIVPDTGEELVNEVTHPGAYETQIAAPARAWLLAHPEKPIRYIIVVRGVPWRFIVDVSDPRGAPLGYHTFNIADELSRCLTNSGDRNGVRYDNMGPNPPRFCLAQYRGMTALVALLVGDSYAACRAIVDKVAAHYTDDVLVRSTGSKWYIDDTREIVFKDTIRGATIRDAILAAGGTVEFSTALVDDQQAGQTVGGETIIAEGDLSTMIRNLGATVLGYFGWGGHSALELRQDVDAYITVSGLATLWACMTGESFSGISYHDTQSSYQTWTRPDAWGGVAYSAIPVAGFINTDEPTTDGCAVEVFANLQRGLPCIEAFWAARQSRWSAMFGDILFTAG